MKNKKLFAILTLVCFMFTLMPVAAFAADDAVYVKTAAGSAVQELDTKAGAEFFAGVNSGMTTEGYVFYVVDEDGEGVAVSADGSFKINAEGSYEVYALAATDAIVDYVEAVGDPAVKVAELEKYYANDIVLDYATVTVEANEFVYKIELSKDADYAEYCDLEGNATDGYTMSVNANNGFNEDGYVVATLSYKVKGAADSTYKAVKAGYELTISEAGYVDVTADTLKTDKKGQVKFNVSADVANEGNKVIVKFGKAKAELTVDADVTNVSNVVVNAEPTAPVNDADTIVDAGIEFKFTDADGIAATVVPADYAITIVDQPANSKMKARDFKLVADDEGKAGVYDLVSDEYAVAEDDTVTDGKFAKEGTYVIKVSLENGASATATVEVAEMGDVVAIQFVKAPTTVAVGTTTQFKKVVAVDANGVTDDVTDEVVFSANGSAIGIFRDTAVGGVLTVKDDPDYIGSTVTVMAVYEKEFVATTTVQVTNSAATVKYLSNKAEVGVSTVLNAMIIDEAGKMSGTGIASDKVNVEVIVLDKPANAIAVATPKATLNDKAMVELTFLASAAGEYKIQTIVTWNAGTEDAPALKYISGIETITVGGGVNAFKDVVVVSLGADKMIVNNEVVALDVAPFIENNRTMMQFNVLYVFGIDVEWVAETQSIVAEGNGLKVVMQLGSKVATVNGEEVALDVAPYTVNGRTVVPVGFITGLLDITPTFTYNADGTIADILFTK